MKAPIAPDCAAHENGAILGRKGRSQKDRLRRCAGPPYKGCATAQSLPGGHRPPVDWQRRIAPDCAAHETAQSRSQISTGFSTGFWPLMLTLRRYQLDAVEAVLGAVSRGLRRVVLSHATGLGKTLVAADIIRRRPGRALFLAHREELLQQALDKLRLICPEARLGLVRAGSDDVGADVIVASVPTLARPARLARVLEAGAFQTVVVDEAHHGTAATYRAVLEGVGAFGEDAPLVVGLSATPYRSSGEPLSEIFEEVSHEMDVLAGIRGGFLVDVRAKRVELDVDFGFHVRQGDYALREVEDALRQGDAPEVVARACQEHAPGRKGLVFTPTIALAHETAAALQGAGIAAEALSGETPAEARRAILRRLRSGETRAVCNAAVLTEGFDEPTVDLIVVARPTRSKGLFTQMVGRGTRTHPGKTDLLVLDLVGATNRLDLVTTASLFDVPAEALDGGSVLEAIEAQERAAIAADRVETEAASLRAQTVDLFARRRLAWTETAGVYSLSLSRGTVLLVCEVDDADLWRVVEVRRAKRPGQQWAVDEVRTLAEGLPLPYAQGVGEDHVRAKGALQLNDRAAPWREQPASPAQRGRLVKWGLWRQDINKGDASDLIGARVALRAVAAAQRECRAIA